MAGIAFLRKLLMKKAMKESAPFQHEGIMSISKSLSSNVDTKVKRWVESAKKQGQDIDKMGEQEIKYIIELNKPKGPTILGHPVIDATSPEGKGITQDLFNMLDRQSGKNVIKTDFGGGITDIVTETITKIKVMKPIDGMKEANSVLARKGKYKNLTEEQSQKIIKDTEDHIFERNIKPDPEDFAHGGRTGSGLNYLLGEDDQNSRVPFGAGGFNAARRKFLQLMGGAAAGAGAAKTGLFGLLKGGGKKEVIKELTSVPINNIEGMPVWFKPLVNRVIKEGDDVTKKFGTVDREIVHKTKLPDSQTDVIVTQDLTTGDVVVDIGMGKHGFKEGHLGQPVRLEYKAAEDIMAGPDMDAMFKVGERDPHIKVKSRDEMTFDQKKYPDKKPEEFWVEEAEFTGGHPENVKFEETISEKFGQHGSNFDEVEKFATGTVKKTKKTESRVFGKKYLSEGDDFASGGRVPMWMGGGLGKGKVLLREMIEYFAKGSKHGKKPSEYLKISNPKQYQKLLDDLSMYKKYHPGEGIMAPDMIKNMIKKTEGERAGIIEQMISSARNIKKADDSVVLYKKQMVDEMVSKGMDKKTAETLADGLSKTIRKDVGPKNTPKITDEGLLELETIHKNILMKEGRKLNATGGRVPLGGGGDPGTSSAEEVREAWKDYLKEKEKGTFRGSWQEWQPIWIRANLAQGGRVPLAEGKKVVDPGYFKYQEPDEYWPSRYEYDASNPKHMEKISDWIKKRKQELIEQGIIKQKTFSEKDIIPSENYLLEAIQNPELYDIFKENTPEELEEYEEVLRSKQEVKDGGRVPLGGGGIAGMLGE